MAQKKINLIKKSYIFIIIFTILIGVIVYNLIQKKNNTLSNSLEQQNISENFSVMSQIETLSDAIKFKNEYENIETEDDIELRNISIPDNNPFIYKQASDIIEMINKKESFFVYFGFPTCPWCRSILPTFIEVAKDYKINEIYYVDIKNIRDVIQFDENENLTITQKGSDDYYKLLNLLDIVLEEYTIKNKKEEEINVGEKRIYAPNIIKIVNGKATMMTTGISDLQTSKNMDLTDEIKADIYKKIEDILK